MTDHIVENKVFEAADFTVEPLEKATYDECSFVSCNFSNSQLSQRAFIDCRFENCIMDSSKLLETRFNDVHFMGCKMLGMDFSGVNTFNFSVKFDDCQLDYSLFMGLLLKRQIFTDCRLIEVDFTGAKLEMAIFERCDLSGTLFENCNLQKADFRTSINFRIDPHENLMKHASFSTAGLAGLLTKYKLKISD